MIEIIEIIFCLPLILGGLFVIGQLRTTYFNKYEEEQKWKDIKSVSKWMGIYTLILLLGVYLLNLIF